MCVVFFLLSTQCLFEFPSLRWDLFVPFRQHNWCLPYPTLQLISQPFKKPGIMGPSGWVYLLVCHLEMGWIPWVAEPTLSSSSFFLWGRGGVEDEMYLNFRDKTHYFKEMPDVQGVVCLCFTISTPTLMTLEIHQWKDIILFLTGPGDRAQKGYSLLQISK